MQFAPQQDEALKAVSKWLKEGRSPLFRLFGYAGTGKTTLAKHFAENVDGDVLFAAFTGKAAQVLRSRGASNARTIHSLIYRPRGEEAVEDEETGKTSIAPMFSINRQSPVAKAALIIVDECSMVDEALGKDLMSFGTPILVLGDPGQLPPVSGGGYFTNQEPDYLLTDIHRQARDNPIIKLAMQVREGNEVMYGDYGTAKVISKNEVTQQLVLDADQVLVGTNKHAAALQSAPARTEGLQRRLSADRRQARLPAERSGQGPAQRLALAGDDLVQGNDEARHQSAVRPEDDDMDRGAAKIKLLKQAFEDVEGEIPWNTRKRYDEFDYGYALTVHKAQGSQWNDVVLFDESWAFRDTRERWLYTAITRAAETLTIVRYRYSPVAPATRSHSPIWSGEEETVAAVS